MFFQLTKPLVDVYKGFCFMGEKVPLSQAVTAHALLNTPIILHHHRSPNEVERNLVALGVLGVVAYLARTGWIAPFHGGLHTRILQKVSLRYYTHNLAQCAIPSL